MDLYDWEYPGTKPDFLFSSYPGKYCRYVPPPRNMYPINENIVEDFMPGTDCI